MKVRVCLTQDVTRKNEVIDGEIPKLTIAGIADVIWRAQNWAQTAEGVETDWRPSVTDGTIVMTDTSAGFVFKADVVGVEGVVFVGIVYPMGDTAPYWQTA
jgi:hypothetical protein